MNNKKYHIIYRTHNLINQKEYTGKHSTNDLEDGYYGSSKVLDNAINKYNIKNFAVEILSFHDTEENAYLEEAHIVNQEYIDRRDTYNQKLGGNSGLSGYVIVKNSIGKIETISVNDPRYLNGELKHIFFNKVNVKDKNGNKFQVDKDDPRWLSGELVALSKGRINVKDKNNNILSVSIDNPKIKAGELISIHKDKVNVKDKNGNKFQVDKDDPRWLSGELVGVNKGIKHKPHKPHKKPKSYKKHNPRTRPNKIMILRKCPYCKKEGRGGSMTRFHFNNCKFKY